jgi:hypothetical protein
MHQELNLGIKTLMPNPHGLTNPSMLYQEQQAPPASLQDARAAASEADDRCVARTITSEVATEPSPQAAGPAASAGGGTRIGR